MKLFEYKILIKKTLFKLVLRDKKHTKLHFEKCFIMKYVDLIDH